MRAYIFLTTKPGTSVEVVREVRSREEVRSYLVLADSIYGRYDAIVVIDAPNFQILTETIYQVIERQPNVLHTETSIAFFESPPP